MTVNTEDMPADVLAALQDGDRVSAIRLLGEARGLEPQEAEEIVDAFQTVLDPRMEEPTGLSAEVPRPLPSAAVVAAIQRGNKVEAIRLLREESGMGLKDALLAVEAAALDPKLMAPGETARSFTTLIWVGGFALMGLLAYLVLR